MGTRNLTCVIQNGEYKVAQYGQWDGYPEGQGQTIVAFLRKEGNLAALREKVQQCRFGEDTELQLMWDAGNGDHLSRDHGAEILQLIAESENGLALSDRRDFAHDSLFCEWAYVLDLDNNILEVYKGFNQEPLAETERFYTGSEQRGYYPVKFICHFDITNLPSDEEFVSVCQKAAGYDEEE